MDKGKPGACESVERVSHFANTETYSDEKESLSSSEKIDAASNDMFQISASTSEASSKEAADTKEEIPQIDSGTDASQKSCSGTNVKSPVETSNVVSENEAEIAAKVPSAEASKPIPHESECVGAEAKPLADVPNPLTMEKIGKVMSDIFPSLASMCIPSEGKTCLGAIPKTTVSQRRTHSQRYEISEGNQKSPESYQKFLRSRSKPLKKLSSQMESLKYFMEDVKMETSGPKCLDSDGEACKRLCKIFENWKNVVKYLDIARQMIKMRLDNTVENDETCDMQNWIRILSSLRIYLEELDGLCRGTFNQNRSKCDHFPRCEFMLRIDLFPEIARDVIYRVTYETIAIDNFHRYGSDSESTD